MTRLTFTFAFAGLAMLGVVFFVVGGGGNPLTLPSVIGIDSRLVMAIAVVSLLTLVASLNLWRLAPRSQKWERLRQQASAFRRPGLALFFLASSRSRTRAICDALTDLGAVVGFLMWCSGDMAVVRIGTYTYFLSYIPFSVIPRWLMNLHQIFNVDQ